MRIEYRVWVDALGTGDMFIPVSKLFPTIAKARSWAAELNSDEWRIEPEDID
jgi:hypothetical protein